MRAQEFSWVRGTEALCLNFPVSAPSSTWPHLDSIFRYSILQINESVYRAVRPALILNEVVKRGLHDEGWSLPALQHPFKHDNSPQMAPTEFVRHVFHDEILPRVVWENYPSPLDCQEQRTAAIRYMASAGTSYTPEVDAMKTPNRPIMAPRPPPSDSSSPGRPEELGDYLKSPDGKLFSFVR